MTDTVKLSIISSLDILLKETDTVWMFVLPGTAKEIEGDEDVQRTLQKRAKKEPGKNQMTGEGKEDEKETETKEGLYTFQFLQN